MTRCNKHSETDALYVALLIVDNTSNYTSECTKISFFYFNKNYFDKNYFDESVRIFGYLSLHCIHFLLLR